MAKECVIANLFFLLTKNDIIVHYNKFPNLGVYHAKFSNLEGRRVDTEMQNVHLWADPEIL